MIIITQPISLAEIHEKHSDFYEAMVKIVVDLKEKKIAINADLHVDLEQALLEEGSSQGDLWGANLYFEREGWIEYNSMINLRPSQGNFIMDVQDPKLQEQIRELVDSLIRK